MKKQKLKIILITILMFVLLSSVCYADEQENVSVTSEQNQTTSSTEENEPEVISDDLYSFSTDVSVNKIVDGNVHIVGQNVTIDTQVIGNVFVVADTITFTENTYVQGTCYVLANKIILKGMVYDLYSSSDSLSIVSGGAVYRDLRAMASDVDIQGRVGRNAFIAADNLKIATDKGTRIYGNLEYTSNNDLGDLKEIVSGTAIRKENKDNAPTTKQLIMNYVVSAVSELFFTTALFLLMLWLTPKAISNLAQTLTKKFPISIGFGALALIAIPIISVFAMASTFTIGIGIALITSYFLLICITSAILSITIAKVLNERFKLNKKYLLYLITLAVCLVLWVLKQIPYVGLIVTVFIIILGLGILIENLICNRKKEKELEQK